MFLTFGEITLVENKNKRKPGDDIVYIWDQRILMDNRTEDRVLCPDFGNFREQYFGSKWAQVKRYGTIYQDTSNNWCVVPDIWNQADADLAKLALPMAV